MINIPIQLYSEEIISIINDEIINHNIKYFDDIDDVTKDHLVSHAIKSFENDIEIVLSRETNERLSNYLLSYSDHASRSLKISIQEDYREYFSTYFDYLILEKIEEIKSEKLQEKGFRYYACDKTGETLWSNVL